MTLGKPLTGRERMETAKDKRGHRTGLGSSHTEPHLCRGDSAQPRGTKGLGFPLDPKSSPDFQSLTESPGLSCLPDTFLVWSFSFSRSCQADGESQGFHNRG